MKQIVFILLFIFIFTLQIRTPNPPSRGQRQPPNQHQTRESSKNISPSQECPSGYHKICFLKGIDINTKNIPKTCRCYESKHEKIKRILKEIRTTKDKTTKVKERPLKERLPKDKYFPLRGKLEHVEKNSKRCNGDYYVCYNYPLQKVSRCHCSKFPY